MSESPSILDVCASVRRPALLDRLARRALLSRLEHIAVGHLIIEDGDERHVFGAPTPHESLNATIVVHDPAFYRRVVAGGINGSADAYIDGLWSCDHLTRLVTLILRNERAMFGLDGGLARIAVWADRARHWLARNTTRGSRRNIAAHYDLGNDFFAAFLDDNMMYSCALFDDPHTSLADAQHAKLELICRKLDLNAKDRVVEIGAGWGGFALHAAGRFGCRVTTTTISKRQFDLARERVRAAGLQDRVTVLFEDYRALAGQYDKLVSIEMIEAVGHQFYPAFFGACERLLKPDGLALIQAITIPDRLYAAHLRSSDVIKRFVFPGSNIPSLGALTHATAATDLRLVHAEDFGGHYAETLRRWRHNIVAAAPCLRAAGYNDALLRLWDFYLSYCEAGFQENYIGLSQLMWARPGAPSPSVRLGMTASDAARAPAGACRCAR